MFNISEFIHFITEDFGILTCSLVKNFAGILGIFPSHLEEV